MSGDFAGKVVLITGGARNLGSAMGKAFANAGAAIVINSRSDRPELAEAVKSIQSAGGEALSYVADVTDRVAVDRMISTILQRFDRLDVVISNAVTHATKPFLQLTYNEWRAPIAVSLDGTFHVVQAAAPAMIEPEAGA